MYRKFERLLVKYNVQLNQVAQATGISRPCFTYWKQGKYSPNLKSLQKLANFFGVSVDYFLK